MNIYSDHDGRRENSSNDLQFQFVSSEHSLRRHEDEWYGIAEQISIGLATHSMNYSDAIRRISESDSLTNSHPELSVPDAFIAAHPNIYFSTYGFDDLDPARQAKGFELPSDHPFILLYDLLKQSSLDEMPVRNPLELQVAWSKIRDLCESSGVSIETTQQLLTRATWTVYLHNLELHRLTKDAEGTIMRYTQNEDEHPPQKLLRKDPPWIKSLPRSTRKIAENKLVTYWYRKDGRPWKEWYQNRKVAYATIQEMEQTHMIALDTAQDCALVLIEIRK